MVYLLLPKKKKNEVRLIFPKLFHGKLVIISLLNGIRCLSQVSLREGTIGRVSIFFYFRERYRDSI